MSPILFLLAAGSAFADGPEMTPERVMAALDLPAKAQALRDHGVDADQVKEALQASREQGLAAADVSALLDEAGTAVSEHGTIDNFGALVKGKLDEGLRGQDLAAAIQAEYADKGKGKGKGHADGDEHDAEEHGEGAGHGNVASGKLEGANTQRTRGESNTKRTRGEGSGTQRTRGESSGTERTRGESGSSRSRGESTSERTRGDDSKSTEKSDTKRSR